MLHGITPTHPRLFLFLSSCNCLKSRVYVFDLHAIYVVFQDSYAIQSFERGISAQNAGHFAWEIVPV